jgi:hypothetical protein
LVVVVCTLITVVFFALRPAASWKPSPGAGVTRQVAPPPSGGGIGTLITKTGASSDSAAFGSGFLGVSSSTSGGLVDRGGRYYSFSPTDDQLRRVGHVGHLTDRRLDDFDADGFSSLSGRLLAFDETSIIEVDTAGNLRRTVATLAYDRSKASLALLKESRSALLPGTQLFAVAPGADGSLVVLGNGGIVKLTFPADSQPVVSVVVDRQIIEQSQLLPEDENPRPRLSLAMHGPNQVVVGAGCRAVLVAPNSTPSLSELAVAKAGATCTGNVSVAADKDGNAWMLTPNSTAVVPVASRLGLPPLQLVTPERASATTAIAVDADGSFLTITKKGIHFTGTPTNEFSL